MSTRKYCRDGRAPIPAYEYVSRVMSANKARDTKPELALRSALWSCGIKGYRVNWKKAPGRPDIAFPSQKIAIFIHGCFWHRCPFCRPRLPKTHGAFWSEKFKANIKRDKRKALDLRKAGWKVVTIWECHLRNNMEQSAAQVEKILSNSRKRSK